MTFKSTLGSCGFPGCSKVATVTMRVRESDLRRDACQDHGRQLWLTLRNEANRLGHRGGIVTTSGLVDE